MVLLSRYFRNLSRGLAKINPNQKMTSQLSRNADVTTPVSKIRYLRATKDGFPVDKQISRSIQLYTGAGGVGVTMDYDGSNDVVIFAANLTGDLIIRFCPSSVNDKYNLLGKEVKIHINGSTTRSITLSSSPSFMKINSTSLTQLSHVIIGDTLSKTVTVSFTTVDLWNVDYGSSVSSITQAMTASPKYYRNAYLTLYTDNLSALVKGGVPPYTAIDVSGFGLPNIDLSLGRTNIDNIAGTFSFYPPSETSLSLRTVPLTVSDSSGQSVLTNFTYIQNKLALPAAATVTSSTCTCIGTDLGVQGIYITTYNSIGPVTATTLILTEPATTITNFAVNQTDSVVYYTTAAGGLSIFYYDPIKTTNKGTIDLSLTPTIASSGITAIRCLAYNHDTRELYIFGNTVQEPIYVVRLTTYQRAVTTATIPQRMTSFVLNGPLNPALQPSLAAIYGNTSYVTGCEFIDSRNLVVISLYDPSVNFSRIVTLNFQLFINTGAGADTSGGRYLLGSYSPATLNSRLVVFSHKIDPLFNSLCTLSNSTKIAQSQRDLNWNVIGNDGRYSVFSLSLTLPTEVRCGRHIITF